MRLKQWITSLKNFDHERTHLYVQAVQHPTHCTDTVPKYNISENIKKVVVLCWIYVCDYVGNQMFLTLLRPTYICSYIRIEFMYLSTFL